MSGIGGVGWRMIVPLSRDARGPAGRLGRVRWVAKQSGIKGVHCGVCGSVPHSRINR